MTWTRVATILFLLPAVVIAGSRTALPFVDGWRIRNEDSVYDRAMVLEPAWGLVLIVVPGVGFPIDRDKPGVSDMASTLRVTYGKAKARHIDGAQFQFGLDEVKLSAERFAELFCNGRTKRVREWLDGELPVPPWVPALLAAMLSPDGRTRAIATAEHLIAAAAADASGSR